MVSEYDLMKVMPNVLGQVAQDVAENLYEVGKSAVKSTAKVLTDVTSGSIEQITNTPSQAHSVIKESQTTNASQPSTNEIRKRTEKMRFDEVRSELAAYVARKQQLDQRIAEDKMKETEVNKQKKVEEKGKRDNWVNRIINRSQTNTEKGRLQE